MAPATIEVPIDSGAAAAPISAPAAISDIIMSTAAPTAPVMAPSTTPITISSSKLCTLTVVTSLPIELYREASAT